AGAWKPVCRRGGASHHGPVRLHRSGNRTRASLARQAADQVSVRTLRLPTRSVHMVERNAMALGHNGMVIFSGFVEPVIDRFGIGCGIGSLVRTVNLGDGHAVSYAVFVAPALMASSAMNGAIYESTFNLFYKLRYAKTFESVISTPVGVEDATLGEVIWAVGRGSVYSVGFVVV